MRDIFKGTFGKVEPVDVLPGTIRKCLEVSCSKYVIEAVSGQGRHFITHVLSMPVNPEMPWIVGYDSYIKEEVSRND